MPVFIAYTLLFLAVALVLIAQIAGIVVVHVIPAMKPLRIYARRVVFGSIIGFILFNVVGIAAAIVGSVILIALIKAAHLPEIVQGILGLIIIAIPFLAPFIATPVGFGLGGLIGLISAMRARERRERIAIGAPLS